MPESNTQPQETGNNPAMCDLRTVDHNDSLIARGRLTHSNYSVSDSVDRAVAPSFNQIRVTWSSNQADVDVFGFFGFFRVFSDFLDFMNKKGFKH